MGITTKAHVTANEGTGELLEILSSKADTEDEKRGLRKLLEIHEATHSADAEIGSELSNAGLERTAHWSRTPLGVRTLQGLQHIESESYADLESIAHKSWEKKTHRKIFEMENEETAIKSLHIKETNGVTTIVAQSTVTNKVMHNSHPKQNVTSQAGAHKVAFQVLLKMVDLEKYYPQKLTPKDAVCICKETLGSLQHTEQPELLPYYIMQRMMMCNLKCRARILCTSFRL